MVEGQGLREGGGGVRLTRGWERGKGGKEGWHDPQQKFGITGCGMTQILVENVLDDDSDDNGNVNE